MMNHQNLGSSEDCCLIVSFECLQQALWWIHPSQVSHRYQCHHHLEQLVEAYFQLLPSYPQLQVLSILPLSQIQISLLTLLRYLISQQASSQLQQLQFHQDSCQVFLQEYLQKFSSLLLSLAEGSLKLLYVCEVRPFPLESCGKQNLKLRFAQ